MHGLDLEKMIDVEEVRFSNFARLGFMLSAVSSLLMMAAALGYRWDLWSVRFALLTLTKYATYGALGGAALSMVGIGRTWPGGSSRGLVLSILGVIIGLGAFQTIFEQWRMVRTSPFIHDITTDTESPPEFISLVSVRESVGANPHIYAGDDLPLRQRFGGFNEPYKDILPLMSKLLPGEVYDQALNLAQDMGWEILEADRTFGRIEASDTSFWYGFVDDIVIRIAAVPDGSRVDMRSLSRVGRSDVGVNAARIRTYMTSLSSSPGSN